MHHAVSLVAILHQEKQWAGALHLHKVIPPASGKCTAGSPPQPDNVGQSLPASHRGAWWEHTNATEAVAPSNTHKQLVNIKAAQTCATHWQGTHPENWNYYRGWGQDTGALLQNEHGQPDGGHPPLSLYALLTLIASPPFLSPFPPLSTWPWPASLPLSTFSLSPCLSTIKL